MSVAGMSAKRSEKKAHGGFVKLRTAERSWAGRQPSPSFFKAHTSPLSSQRTLGPGGLDGELLRGDDDRLGTGSGSDRELRENAESVPLI